MKSIADLCARSHATAKEKGWLDKPRSWAGTTTLMTSELSEALEDYRANKGLSEIYMEAPPGADLRKTEGKPCGIPIELADFVIRVAQHCGTEGWDLAGSMDRVGEIAENLTSRPFPAEDFEVLIAETSLSVSLAYGAGRGISLSNSFPKEPLSYLAGAAQEIFMFCEKNDIDLWLAIEMKETFNKTRSFRHGGKRI